MKKGNKRMNSSSQINLKTLMEESKNLTVLYAEDEELLRNNTSVLLRKLFQNVDVAEDGQDAFNKYLHNKYDIVITDISMPNMDGLELIDRIRQKSLSQEIIIMSAYTESSYTEQINTADVTGYIYKPVDMNQMFEILKTSIDRLNDKGT